MNKELEEILTIGQDKPIVIGSASPESKIKNYGDVDINVSTDYKNKDIIIDKIKMIEDKYYLTEIKIQNKDKKYKMKSYKDIGDKINENTDLIKIDFKTLSDLGVESYECLFFLNKKSGSNIKESLNEFLYSKNYWKLLKRLLSISKKTNETEKIKKIVDFLNSYIGKVGKYVSIINTIEELEDVYPEIKKVSISKKKYITKKALDIIKKDNIYFSDTDFNLNPSKWLNYKAREFIRKNNLF